jgi:flagellar motor switch protein FliN
MKSYIDCWISAASALFAQALAGEPELSEAPVKELDAGAFGWAATLDGDVEGRFSVVLDGGILKTTLAGEGLDQKTGWAELLREAANAACGDLLAREGANCQVTKFEEIGTEVEAARSFQLRSGERVWAILVRDEVRIPGSRGESGHGAPPAHTRESTGTPTFNQGLELLLDVELEASLRFGSREMQLGGILDLGPGDVVELDRHIADPVDLIVGDKIVAQGEVVLVNGNFALRVTEVAAPKKRLETIRCLF